MSWLSVQQDALSGKPFLLICDEFQVSYARKEPPSSAAAASVGGVSAMEVDKPNSNAAGFSELLEFIKHLGSEQNRAMEVDKPNSNAAGFSELLEFIKHLGSEQNRFPKCKALLLATHGGESSFPFFASPTVIPHDRNLCMAGPQRDEPTPGSIPLTLQEDEYAELLQRFHENRFPKCKALLLATHGGGISFPFFASPTGTPRPQSVHGRAATR